MVLWFPIHALSIWHRVDEHFPKTSTTYTLKIIAHTMTYANSTVNPIIYAFSNENFQISFSKLFPILFVQKNRNITNLATTRAIFTKTNLAETVVLLTNK